MHRAVSTYQTSDCGHAAPFVAQDNGIGELFRQYGERYIEVYKPNLNVIKLLRSIRICKTPVLGGKTYRCKNCADTRYMYYSCGNSQCPKCQGIKRMVWKDKIANKVFGCPYQHIVFTMPHQLNGLARRHPKEMYNIVMRSAWQSLKICCKDGRNLGTLPGAIMVLHTFGSDLKYHIHVHALVSFGGIDNDGEWQWPKRKNKIVAFRQIRNTFREVFVSQLAKQYDDLEGLMPMEVLKEDLYKKAWCVHQEPPTANSKTIQEYLGKYICRIGLSKQRFHFDKVNQEVSITFKDYRKQNKEEDKAPLATKTLKPLVAINQILQHCLPPHTKCSL